MLLAASLVKIAATSTGPVEESAEPDDFAAGEVAATAPPAALFAEELGGAAEPVGTAGAAAGAALA